jgi:hypothetical protein
MTSSVSGISVMLMDDAPMDASVVGPKRTYRRDAAIRPNKRLIADKVIKDRSI